MFLVFEGAFGMLCVGGARLAHQWMLGGLEHCKCTNAHLEVISFDLSVVISMQLSSDLSWLRVKMHI